VAAYQITPHALEDLYAKDGVKGVALSPSGERIAIIREIHQGGARLSVLDVLDAANPSAPPKRAPLGDVDCESMVWASDERLLVRIALGGRTITERTSARSLGSSTAEAVISRPGQCVVEKLLGEIKDISDFSLARGDPFYQAA
jgi:hypothetical protein